MNGSEDLFAGHPAVPTDLPLPPGKVYVSEESISGSLEEMMARRMPSAAWVCLGLLLLGAIGGVYLGSPQVWTVIGVSIVPVVGAGIFHALGGKVPPRWAHPVATLLMGFVALQYAFLAHLSGDASYAGAILVLITGSAFIFLSLPWFLTALLISSVPVFTVLQAEGGVMGGAGVALAAGLFAVFSLSIQNSRVKDARTLIRYQLEERKRIEVLSAAILEARGSEKRFRKLSEAGREALILHHAGKVVDLNKAAVSMLGYDSAELIGKPVESLVAASDRSFVEQITDRTNDNLTSVTALRRDGLPMKVAAFNHVLISPEETIAVLGLRPLTSIPTEIGWMPPFDALRSSAALRSN